MEPTEVMRPKDDQKFAIALNNFANCRLTDEDIRLFLSRQIEKESFITLPPKAIYLFSTNASVNAHSESVLNALINEGYKFAAIGSLSSDTGSEMIDEVRDLLEQLEVSRDPKIYKYSIYWMW